MESQAVQVFQTALDALTPQQRQAVYLLASGTNTVATSERLGISRATLIQWRKLQTFRAALAEILSEQDEAVRTKLRSLTDDALNCISAMLLDSEVPEYVRLKAATWIIETVLMRSPPVAPIHVPTTKELNNAGFEKQEVQEILSNIFSGVSEVQSKEQRGELTEFRAKGIQSEVLGIDDLSGQKGLSSKTVAAIRQQLFGVTLEGDPVIDEEHQIPLERVRQIQREVYGFQGGDSGSDPTRSF